MEYLYSKVIIQVKFNLVLPFLIIPCIKPLKLIHLKHFSEVQHSITLAFLRHQVVLVQPLYFMAIIRCIKLTNSIHLHFELLKVEIVQIFITKVLIN